MKQILKFILLAFIFINCSQDDTIKENTDDNKNIDENIDENIEFQYYGKWEITFIYSEWFSVYSFYGELDYEWLGENFITYPYNHCGSSESAIISYCENNYFDDHCKEYWEEDSYFEFNDNNTFKEINDYYSVEVISDNSNGCSIKKNLKIRQEKTGKFEYTKDSIQLTYEDESFPIFDDDFYSENNQYIGGLIRDKIITISYHNKKDDLNYLEIRYKTLPRLRNGDSYEDDWFMYYYDIYDIDLSRVEEN